MRYRDQREQTAARINATLPETADAVSALAATAADQYDAAVCAADADAFSAAADLLEAIVYRLNGCTFSGSLMDGGGVEQLRGALQPVDGIAAGWGRPCRFLVELDDVRVMVSYTPDFLSFAPHFEFYAVDADRPFISETGYKSHFYSGRFPPLTLDAFARKLLEASDERRTLRPEYLPNVIERRPVWIGAEQLRGQIGFAF